VHAHHRLPDPREVETLIARRNFAEAARLCRQWVRREPKNQAALSALARSSFALGFYGEARGAASSLLSIRPGESMIEYMLAVSEHNTGQSEEAIGRLQRLCGLGTAIAEDAALALAEVLEQAGKLEELRRHLERGGAWLKADRAATFEAWLLAQSDRASALELLQKVARAGSNPGVRRAAGFAAVQMLDADGRFREAFALAQSVHADSAGTFDLGPLKDRVRDQLAMFDRMSEAQRKRTGTSGSSTRAAQVAFMIALPRSGTTLVEQMLDRHPDLSGIGEYEGVLRVRREIGALHVDMSSMDKLLPADACRIRDEYLAEAVVRARPGAKWILDKSLHPWSCLPWLSAVLPDARYVHLERNARDRAISMFLSNFHPTNWAFTSSLDAIRAHALLAKTLVPRAIEALSLQVVHVQYEHLVDEPEREIRRVFDHLGLPFESAVLQPEANRRAILTLSAQQVRAKINRASIGRWRNYDFAFGPEWDELCPTN
jgi:thioredoxin-like negative regulator of GroEL